MSTVVGWRVWRLLPDGQLQAPFASQGPHGDPAPWRAGTNTAVCLDPRARHTEPPAPGCECGIRAFPRLWDLWAALAPVARSAELRAHLGVAGTSVDQVAVNLGAVGVVELSGRIEGPSPCDAPGTVRGRYGDLLRLSVRDGTDLDAVSRWYPGVPVRWGVPPGG